MLAPVRTPAQRRQQGFFPSRPSCRCNKGRQLGKEALLPGNRAFPANWRSGLIWINNDHDEPGAPGAHDTDLEAWANSPLAKPDYTYGAIRCQRNLEDFARLWVRGLPKLRPSEGYAVTLAMVASSGAPSINLYAAATNTAAYLTDTNAAAVQFTKEYLYGQVIFDYSIQLQTLTNNQVYDLPLATDGTPLFTNFLFEGAGAGVGQLLLTISQTTQAGSNIIAQTSAWLDLRDVRDLFERVRASDVSLADPPTTNTGAFVLEGFTNAMPGSETTQAIVFVHGINNSPWQSENSSETIFKRLFWQGYQGRFAAFRWPSPIWRAIPTSTNQITLFNFNQGEYIAYQSATALARYINDLRARFPSYTIDLMTHSLGVAVGNQAIKLGAHVDNYSMCQAAMSAWAFDGGNTNLVYSYLATGAGLTPDADALGGYNNCFTNVARRVNFYNDDDYALYTGPLGAWEGNQLLMKPDAWTYSDDFSYRYLFDGTNCSYLQYDSEGHILADRLLTQDYEKKAFVARSRTKAVGAAGLKYTPFTLTGGTVTLNVSLQDATKGFTGGAQFGNTRSEHSGEFTKNIQAAVPFYQQLLQTGFQISPSP
jgi:hypothetical protein